MSNFIVLSFLPFILQAVILYVGFGKDKNEFMVLGDRWLRLSFEDSHDKGTKVWKMLIENSIGDSKDKREMRNSVEAVGQDSGMTS